MIKIKTILVFAMMLIGVSSQSQVLLSILFGDKLDSDGHVNLRMDIGI